MVVRGVRPLSVGAGEPRFLFQAAPRCSHSPPAAVCRGLYFCCALSLFPIPVLVLVSPLTVTVSPRPSLEPAPSHPHPPSLAHLCLSASLPPPSLSVCLSSPSPTWATSPSLPPCTHPDSLFLALLCPTSFCLE